MDGLAKNSSRCRKKSRCGAQGWHLPLQAFLTAMTAAAAAAAEAEVQQAEVQQAEEAAAANMALWQHSFSMQRARR
jgi:hypothetical protein